ncbi:MAG: NADH-quinone oxidoreductase subunit NuoF [Limnochordales bacterium]|nr:NADH-quinone oxidoreductase subunit NuoF [Limnochordales bacterium]
MAQVLQIRPTAQQHRPRKVVAQPHFLVGAGTCGLAAGAEKVIQVLEAELAIRGTPAVIKRVGCMGMCKWEVMVDVWLPGRPRLSFGPVNEKNAKRLLHEYLDNGVVPGDMLLGVTPGYEEPPSLEEMEGRSITEEEWLTAPIQPGPNELPVVGRLPLLKDHPMMRHQLRIVLQNCGLIDPESLEEYLERGGYAGLQRALFELSPEQVIEEVTISGLRGRGGAGFPTGKKWALARQAKGSPKYVICNADEGDPGAFMDRSVLEGDPFRILEGMTISAYAIGASFGFIYVRAEYPLAVERLRKAIESAREHGLLGENILGTSFSFDIELKIGAGAFVCGEETALIASVEGKRGMPRPRPPYPAERGVFGCPTNINNVETYANIPDIVKRGGKWFASIGTEKSKGTKVFALSGKVRWSGLIEVPMGTSIRDIVFKIGGGIEGDRKFKAVQMGGPSGGCLPEALLDTPVDYDSLVAAGAIMGSGGMVVMDDTTCMVDVARFFLNFTREESCGQCTPCREGIARLYNLLEEITHRPGWNGGRLGAAKTAEERAALLEEIERLGRTIRDTSLCGLGQTAPSPVLSTLRYFRDEYMTHAVEARCPAGRCSDLLTYSIDEALCQGCAQCARSCPSGAIGGEKGKKYHINPDVCIRCALCLRVCNFGAVKAV